LLGASRLSFNSWFLEHGTSCATSYGEDVKSLPGDVVETVS